MADVNNEAEFEFNVEGLEDVTFTIDELTGDSVEAVTEENNETEVQEENELTFTAPEFAGELTEEGVGETSTTEDKPSDNSVPSSPGEKLVADFASALAKDGIITGIDEEGLKEVKDLSKLAEVIQKTIQSNEFSDLGEREKEFLNALRNGVPIEKAEQLHNTEVQLEQYTEDRFIGDENDDEDTLNQKTSIRENLIYNDLRVRGFSDEDAKRKTKASFTSGEDEEDARLALQNLKTKATERKQMEFQAAEQRKQQFQESIQNLKQNVLKTEEILPGIKVSEEMRERVAEALTVPTGRTQDGKLRSVVSDKRAENAERFDTRLNYLIALGLFDDKPDLSVFTGHKVSSAVRELEKNLDTSGMYDGGRGISLDSVMKAEKKHLDLSLLDNMTF